MKTIYLAILAIFLNSSSYAQTPVLPAYQGTSSPSVVVSTATPLPVSIFGGSNGQCLVSNGTKFLPNSCGGGGSGTVTSITAGSTNIVVTPSPLTTTGTIDIGTAVATSSNNLGFFSPTTSAQLAGVISDETGTGVLTFATAPTFTTSITDPLIIGGTGTASTLTYRTTSGAGATDAHIWQIGNNGATEAMRIIASGNVGIGTTTPQYKLAVNGSLGALNGNFNVLSANFSGAIFNNAAIQSGSTTGGAGIQVSQSTGSAVGSFNMTDTSNSPAINFISYNSSFPINFGYYPAGIFSYNWLTLNPSAHTEIFTGQVGIGTATIQNSATLQVNGTIESGVAGATLGSILLAGNTSGVITEKPQAAAGTYNWNLPVTAGTLNQLLASGGGASTAMSWTTGLTGSGGTPTCGTGCSSVTATSTDIRGSMTATALATTVVLNFSTTLATVPFCTCSGSLSTTTAACTSSTTALTASLSTGVTGDVITWSCPQ